MSSRPLKLLSSMAPGDVLAELASYYQRVSAQPVRCESAGGVDVTQRVQAGEAPDLVVLASAAIDQLQAGGHMLAGSRLDLLKSGIAVAVRAGNPLPDLSTEEATRQAVLTAKSISFSTGPSGVYLERLFARWGILEALRDRIVIPAPGVPVGSLVANGSVELGFQQLSELKHLAGIAVVGPLPPAIQSITIFAGAIGARCDLPDAARALLDFLASPITSGVKQQHGMEAA